ncbi:Fc receptor-like protein 5 isoform X2 [Aquarana catesbeiana]|uniref:Fc receptor-like protein 5 isoform X2 n=1 Tax=Aquarana catesbeiana TaxID=8400 RepID=UPI003CCA1333
MMTSIIVIQFGLFFFVPCSLATDIVQLDVLPNHHIYELGEDVNFTCCSADSMNSKVFEFYKEGSKIHSTEQSTNCTNFEIKIKIKQDAGSFQCLYQELKNGTNIESNMSRSITINVAETPEAPSIILKPSYTVYTKEESFTLTCSPPIGISAKGIQIYQEKKKIHEGDPLHRNYTISASSEKASGKYACKYWVEMNGRNISSSQSDYVTVIVTETPEAPSIILKPSYTVYTKEESFTLTCSPPIGISAKGIQIYQEKKKIHEGDPLHRNYTISASSEKASGKYTCKYWVEINGRNISSSQSDYVTVIVTETPEAPSIILKPSYTVYTKEESFTLTCSPPIGISAKGIQIYQEKKKIHEGDPLHRNYTISASSEKASGKYACKYWVEMNGRNISSSQSDYVTVIVTETPEAPSIRLKPSYTVYTKEESFTLTCSPPNGISAKGIQYYQEKKKIHEGDPLHRDYTISASSEKASGKYACKYWVEINGRNISSSESDYVTVIVTETPETPSIRLTPSYTVYTKEESFTLTCSPPIGISAKGIQIYQEKKKIHEGDPLHSIYAISASSEKASGKYACKYWVEINGRNISSSQSDYVTVIVTDTPPAPLLSLIPMHPVYIRGESIELTCTTPLGSTPNRIDFYKDKQKIEPQQYGIMNISTADITDSAKYSCQYIKNILGRNIHSIPSDEVTIKTVDVPVAPVLTLVPNYQLYVTGETLQMLCMADSSADYNFNIHKNDQLLMKSTVPEKVYRYSILSLNHGDSGNYTCTYHRNIWGRMLESFTSQPLNVHVIDPLPAPNLTLGYSVEKVNDGFQVTLNCSAPDSDLIKTFYFIKTSDIYSEKNVTDYSASLKWELGHISHVTFYCEYEEEIQERNIRSRRSQTLTIPLAGPSLLSPPAVAGIIGVVSLLLCLALVLLFYMKYKRKYKEKRLHFSLYWKTPKKASKQHILNHAKSKEEVNQDQENLREVSGKSKRLSIATAKEDNPEDIAMNFFTFQTGQSKNQPDDDLSTFQSQPEQSEDLSTSALATFHCPPRPSEDLATANCVWNYSYL